MVPPRILSPSGRPSAMRIGGFDIRTLLSGNDAQSFEVFHTVGEPGTGPALHSHSWDETFFVLTGPVRFGVGDSERLAEPGTLVHLPGGERDRYRSGPQSVELLSITSGKSAAATNRDLAALGSPDAAAYGAAAARHGQKARPKN